MGGDRTSSVVVHWFRSDLRLTDNPALHAVTQRGAVLPVYIFDDDEQKIPEGVFERMGGASRWWLHRALHALHTSLQGRLVVMKGSPVALLPQIAKERGVRWVSWNRCYEPSSAALEEKVKTRLQQDGVQVLTVDDGSVLWPPELIRKNDGSAYQVFTPFYRKGCLQAPSPRLPLASPHLNLVDQPTDASKIDALGLLPTIPWHSALETHWEVSEVGAQQRLAAFLRKGLPSYARGRDVPSAPVVSRLSPHLRMGTLSPQQAWWGAILQSSSVSVDPHADPNVDRFCSELGWREFSYNLLHQYPTLPTRNLRSAFNAFPWCDDPDSLKAWQYGRTGLPIVDAGMRELWQTGYMHNRVRMIVGSFLVKNLRIDWRAGARWFWDCLVDADLANNSASWQWIAGCGADAAPYFRVFNPILQSAKFDADASYIKRYVPELQRLAPPYVFDPSSAPLNVLAEAGVTLGVTYPKRIVDLARSREEALAAFAFITKRGI